MTKHRIDHYIELSLKNKRWEAKDLVLKSGLSPSDISKLRGSSIEKLKANVFFRLYKSFGDTCENARKIVYPTLDLKMNSYEGRERTAFGEFMKSYEEIKNSIEEISIKTGITDNRLKDLYFRKGSLEAYELLLIEAAIGKKTGELFEKFFGSFEFKKS